MNRKLVVLSTLAVLGVLGSMARAQSKAFTDVTKDSGVDAVVDGQYKNAARLWLSGMDLVDLDGDGKLDLFLSAHGGAAAAGLGDGKGHFTYADPAGNTIPRSEIHVAYDINEDGLLDLQTTYTDGGGQWWLNQSTPGQLKFVASKIIAAGTEARQNAMIDIDRDGKVDWMHEAGKRGAITWEALDGKGGITPSKQTLTIGPWKVGPGIIPVDLNGDGFIDLIVSKRGYDEETTGRCRIYLNDGEGNFTDATKDCGLDENAFQIEGVGDFRHTGALDLICLEQGKTVAVYLNDGKGKFTKLANAVTGLEHANVPGDANWGIAIMTDLDNDGIPDVMMNGRVFLYVLKGTGGGHFTYVGQDWGIPDYCDAAVDAGVCFGDIDSDGMLDILTFRPGGGNDRRVNAYHNNLPRQNFVNIRTVGLPGNKGAAGAKIRVYEPGALGDAQKLIGYEQVAIFGRQVVHSYYNYTQTERHFGLGKRDSVDVSVEFYPSGKKVEQKGVKAGSTAVVQEN